LKRWKNFFTQVINIHEVHDFRQMHIHTAEVLVPQLCLDEVEIANENLKSYKSRATKQILAELIRAVGELLYCEIHLILYSIWNKE
jgi:hypothetical protein